jgi:hypothetical protein
MSSGSIPSAHTLDCAAHDALQNRDRTKLWRFPAHSLWRSRISRAPLRRQVYAVCASLTALSPRLQIMKGPVYALALRRIRDTGRAMLTQLIPQGRLRLPPGALAALGAPLPLGPVPFDRVDGMLLGLAIGDSLGNTTEGQLPRSRRDIRFYEPNRYASGRAVGVPSACRGGFQTRPYGRQLRAPEWQQL